MRGQLRHLLTFCLFPQQMFLLYYKHSKKRKKSRAMSTAYHHSMRHYSSPFPLGHRNSRPLPSPSSHQGPWGVTHHSEAVATSPLSSSYDKRNRSRVPISSGSQSPARRNTASTAGGGGGGGNGSGPASVSGSARYPQDGEAAARRRDEEQQQQQQQLGDSQYLLNADEFTSYEDDYYYSYREEQTTTIDRGQNAAQPLQKNAETTFQSPAPLTESAQQRAEEHRQYPPRFHDAPRAGGDINGQQESFHHQQDWDDGGSDGGEGGMEYDHLSGGVLLPYGKGLGEYSEVTMENAKRSVVPGAWDAPHTLRLAYQSGRGGRGPNDGQQHKSPRRRGPARVPVGYIYKNASVEGPMAPTHVQVAMGFRPMGSRPQIASKVTQHSPWKPLDQQAPLPTLEPRIASPPRPFALGDASLKYAPTSSVTSIATTGAPAGSTGALLARREQAFLLEQQRRRQQQQQQSISLDDRSGPASSVGSPRSAAASGGVVPTIYRSKRDAPLPAVTLADYQQQRRSAPAIDLPRSSGPSSPRSAVANGEGEESHFNTASADAPAAGGGGLQQRVIPSPLVGLQLGKGVMFGAVSQSSVHGSLEEQLSSSSPASSPHAFETSRKTFPGRDSKSNVPMSPNRRRHNNGGASAFDASSPPHSSSPAGSPRSMPSTPFAAHGVVDARGGVAPSAAVSPVATVLSLQKTSLPSHHQHRHEETRSSAAHHNSSHLTPNSQHQSSYQVTIPSPAPSGPPPPLSTSMRSDAQSMAAPTPSSQQHLHRDPSSHHSQFIDRSHYDSTTDFRTAHHSSAHAAGKDFSNRFSDDGDGGDDDESMRIAKGRRRTGDYWPQPDVFPAGWEATTYGLPQQKVVAKSPRRRGPARVPVGYIYKNASVEGPMAPTHVQVAMGFRPMGSRPQIASKVTQHSPWKSDDQQAPLPTLEPRPKDFSLVERLASTPLMIEVDERLAAQGLGSLLDIRHSSDDKISNVLIHLGFGPSDRMTILWELRRKHPLPPR